MIDRLRIVDEVAVVTATADFHPLRQLKQLAAELVSLGFEGLVLFDLFAVNGLAPNRFVSMMFSDDEFKRSSFSVVSDVEFQIQSEQDLMFKNDQAFLFSSVLSSVELQAFTRN